MDPNERKIAPAPADSPASKSLFVFAAGKCAVSALLVIFFATSYLVSEVSLPEWPEFRRAIVQLALAATAAGILFYCIEHFTSESDIEVSGQFNDHGDILVLLSARLLPVLSLIATFIFAAVLLRSAISDIAVAGLVGLCVGFWIPYERIADRFLLEKQRR